MASKSVTLSGSEPMSILAGSASIAIANWKFIAPRVQY